MLIEGTFYFLSTISPRFSFDYCVVECVVPRSRHQAAARVTQQNFDSETDVSGSGTVGRGGTGERDVLQKNEQMLSEPRKIPELLLD